MLDTNNIKNIVEEKLEGTPLFLLDIKCTPDNNIELVLDSDASVTIDDCAELSRFLEGHLDREQEDFQLSVYSAGIGQPLKILRQYKKLLGKPVEILLANGTKMTAILEQADDNSITVSYQEKIAEEGKKKKQTVEKREQLLLQDIKYTKEYLDYK